jgi:hypothetical protein
MKNLGNVYFLQCGGLIKIGFARDVAKRLAELQTGNPEPLKLVAVIPGCLPSVERRYHREFATARRRGEWFDAYQLKDILRHISAGAKPRTVAEITFLRDPKMGAQLQRELGRTISAVRKAVRAGAAFEDFAGRGPVYDEAIRILQRPH